MHLAAIKLRGFKSFPDPVEVSLEPGVAVVVGPNGSGKSNVVDAIAWVLVVRALRDRLMPLVEPNTGPRERIYISRAGRRRVLNEDALVTMLDRYDFRVIDDKPRTLAEQLTIYNRASFVMGPHGASFSNLIWCEPGTHLFELFSPNYTPDFFAYLAELMGLRYSAHAAGKPRPDGLQLLEDDMTVSVADVERGLNQLLERDYRASVPH